jgi:hypothetical protein
MPYKEGPFQCGASLVQSQPEESMFRSGVRSVWEHGLAKEGTNLQKLKGQGSKAWGN